MLKKIVAASETRKSAIITPTKGFFGKVKPMKSIKK